MKNRVLKSEENKKKPASAKEDKKIYSSRGHIFNILIILSLLAYFLPYAVADDNFLSKDARKSLLKNGLTVILKKDSRTPTVAVTLLVNTGSSSESAYSGSGITHLIEHMMFKGTKNYNAIELEKRLRALGAQTNAFTSLDYTCFKAQAPKSSLSQLLQIMLEMVASPAFDKEEFEKEKQVILREIDMGNDDPEKFLYKLLWQTAYIHHPYKNPIIGHKEIFQGIQLSDVTAYYNLNYVPSNMILSIVGDIDPSLLLEDIKRTFGALKMTSFNPPVLPNEPEQISGRQHYQTFSVSRPMLLVGFHSVEINNSDLYALDTLAIILGAGPGSRLYKSLHDDKKLVTSTTSYNYTPRYDGLFIISAVTEPNVVDEAVNTIKEELAKIKQSPPKDSELNKAKAKVLSSYYLELETQQDKADALATDFALTGDLGFQDRYVKGIESVTAEDVTKVASKYLTEQNMSIVELLPMDDKAKESAAQSLAETVYELNTVKNTLANGLAVLVTENHTTPACSIVLSVKGGLRAEDAKNNGISNLLVYTMIKGTTSHKKDQITEYLDSIGAQLSPYAGNNSFGFVINFMSKDLEKVIALLSSVILNPTFPEEEINITKGDILANIDLMHDDIFKHTDISLRKNLFKNHPYGFISLGSKETVANVSRADLVDFHKKFCVGKNTVISICGNINKEKTFEIIKNNFDNMREGEAFAAEQINLDPIMHLSQMTEQMKKAQAVIMIGFRGASIYNNERHPLQVLSALFSDGSGRLYSQIRQKEGLAYTVGTFGMVGLDTGVFIFYAATAPQNVNHVKESIVTQIEQISSGDITEDELNSARKSLLIKYQLSLQSNENFALQTGLDELYGLGYDYYIRYPEIINSISKKDLIIIAKKYLEINKSVTIITLPAQD